MFPFSVSDGGVTLRDFTESDRAGFLGWASDDLIYKYMTFRFTSEREAEAEFERLLDHPSRLVRPREHYYLALLACEVGGETFAGITGFDVHGDRSGEFGWYLASRYWNHGLATRATLLLLRLGFEQLGLELLTATCDPENSASRRVLEKTGLRFVRESVTPVATWQGPRRRLEFAIDRAAWARWRAC